MDFETQDRQRRLALIAYDIVTKEAQSLSTWEDDCRFEERVRTGEYLTECVLDNAEMAPYVAAARKEHAVEIKRLRRNQLERAQNTIAMWADNGWGIAPFWARNTVAHLQHLEEDDDASDVDEAIAAIKAVLR